MGDIGIVLQTDPKPTQKRRLRKEHVRANEASVFPQVYNTVIYDAHLLYLAKSLAHGAMERARRSFHYSSAAIWASS